MAEKNFGGWFEIPVTNMERAIAFYEKVFNCNMTRNSMGPLDMAWFPWFQGGEGAAGTLVHHPDFYQPSTQGTLIYLISRTDNLADELSRIESAGGTILVPKTQISPDHGYMAVFLDTEGNRVALHSIG